MRGVYIQIRGRIEIGRKRSEEGPNKGGLRLDMYQRENYIMNKDSCVS